MTQMAQIVTAIAGAVAGVLAALLGYVGTQRSRKATESVAVMDQVREWATQLQDAESKCRAELVVVRSEVHTLRRELDDLRRTVER